MNLLHETLNFSQTISASLARVWEAFAEPRQRAIWGPPSGEVQIFDQAQFRVGGRDLYRCGSPDALDYRGVVDYIHIVEHRLILHTDVVYGGDQLLSAALLTIEFADSDSGTQIAITDQLTSFVGEGMVEGHQKGQTIALNQLAAYVEHAPGEE
ncbi:SRPBCC domain-containing protein [Nesterenkonia sp. Act20]|uniref:SRPBCC domain-containing protein n=1 Tax=Nesterenkonia sp. Act20 TaxID=1483432 RepID=UPI0021000E04|nr:SRPBCC domain-containing protein [Nesterenkonia sp. Act20]